MSEEKFGCASLHEAVKNSFPAPNYLYMREVRDATGYDAVRSADGIAVGMYRSCGRQIHGFEMKVSRTDWLKELSNAAKAESLMRYCHRWALIVPDASIVHDGELPPTWGMGVPDRTRKNALLRVKWIVKPPELTPLPFSMVFLTALLYASTKVDEPDRAAALAAEYERGRKREKEIAASRSEEGRDEKLRATVAAFEKASGVGISDWLSTERAAMLGSTFREYEASKGSLENMRRRFDQMRERAKDAVKDIEAQIKRIDEGPPPPLKFNDYMGEATQ